jgi:hypothetical protein
VRTPADGTGETVGPTDGEDEDEGEGAAGGAGVADGDGPTDGDEVTAADAATATDGATDGADVEERGDPVSSGAPLAGASVASEAAPLDGRLARTIDTPTVTATASSTNRPGRARDGRSNQGPQQR